VVDGKYARNPHKRIAPIGIKPEGGKLSKEERIRMYAQKPMQEKRVYLRRGMTKLRQQIVEFPHGPMVDRLDAAAYLIHLLRPPISDADVESSRAADQVAKLGGKNFTHQEFDRGGYA
jgi:hypothetical protein